VSESLPLLDDCWNRIGVGGDRTCPKLPSAIHCKNCSVFTAASQLFFDRTLAPDYENELTALVAAVPNGAGEGSLSLLTFLIGNEAFALETRSFVEVTEERRVHRVPHRTSHVFAGMVNIHGQLELCVSLVGLLETDPPASDSNAERHTRMVVVEDARGRRWVFRADAVLGVELVARRALSNAPTTVARKPNSFVKQVFEQSGRHVGLLDAEALFAALDRSVR
jgi:chemotaxis-related protein WspD